jgi:hypothetical protein
MIAIFDEDGNGSVDFQEFIAGLSAFSSKGNKEEKLRCTNLILLDCVDRQLRLRFMIWIVMAIFQMVNYLLC